MGLSGSGKSTLVRHINRLIQPTHGRILINGQDIGALSAEELCTLRANQIGMVFQNMALLPHSTVRDNIVFALELRNTDPFITRHQLADRLLGTVGLQGYGDSMPSKFSGGGSSVSDLPEPWPQTRESCSWTSHSPPWIP